MVSQYSYKAVAQNKKTQEGFISASSVDDAKKTLEGMGLTVTSLILVEIGRTNPFVPYYTVIAPVVVPTTPASP
jgi:type II secretory pathway component PulF